MLTQSTTTQIIKVGTKNFCVVPVLFDQKPAKSSDKKDSHHHPKSSQNKPGKEEPKVKEPEEEEECGWINVDEGGVVHQEPIKDEPEPQEPEDTDKVEFDIDQTITAARGTSSEKFTHFFSIPLNKKTYSDQLKKLRLEIYKFFDEGFEEFIERPDKAHITLLMLNLDKEEKIKKLDSLKGQIQQEIHKHIHAKELSIQFGELGIFDKYNKKQQEKLARVLYASIRDTHTINELVNTLTQLMIKNGILNEQDLTQVRLNKATKKYELTQPHVTIIKIPDEKLRDDDLRIVWSRVKKFTFNEVLASNIDISTRGEFDDDGFYKPLHRFEL